MRGRVAALVAVLLGAMTVAGCGAGGAKPDATSVPSVDVGARAAIDDVPYIAIERVGEDRLPRSRLEPGGEARIDAIVRRITAYRLNDSPKAALRYTPDGARGWLTWQPLAVLYARQSLARAQNVVAGSIQTLDVLSEVWTDSCLNIPPLPGASCGPASIPGFRVMLRLGGRTHEFHTDQTDRVADATP
jgi:hypothetical protein